VPEEAQHEENEQTGLLVRSFLVFPARVRPEHGSRGLRGPPDGAGA
jgi:hypothetical protein